MLRNRGVVRAFAVATALAASFACQGCFDHPPAAPTTPAIFSKYDGFIGDRDGSADEVSSLPARQLTLDEAKTLCRNELTCLGFSFQGEMDQGRQLVHFKSHVAMYNDCWVSYKKGTEYERHDGFISDDNNQCSDLETDKNQQMSLQDAKEQCTRTSNCAGFTVRGYTHNELESANNVQAEVHFKDTWSPPVHNCWTSYVKEHPPPPSPPPRPTTPAPAEEEVSEENSDEGYYGAETTTVAPSDYYGAGATEAADEATEAADEASAYYGGGESEQEQPTSTYYNR